jgi:hypothetical protein
MVTKINVQGSCPLDTVYLTTEKKAQRNLSQVKKTCQSKVYILPKHPHTHTQTYTHAHARTHIHVTKQYKTTTVQIKTNTVHKIYPNETVTIQSNVRSIKSP